jgi:hypothetical protein
MNSKTAGLVDAVLVLLGSCQDKNVLVAKVLVQRNFAPTLTR